MTNKPHLYSLFFVAPEQAHHVNLASRGRNPIDIYLECGIGLAKSCAKHGIDYSIITNDKTFVDGRIAAMRGTVATIGQEFDREVPADARFYAAHFKLDVLHAFGQGRYGANIGLIDIDTIVLRPLLLTVDDDATLLVYDISDQVRPESGDAVVLRDLERIGGPPADRAYWYGGEFIAGRAAAFARLAQEIEILWPAYSAVLRELHHVGDEMIVTAALGRLRGTGLRLVDLGQSGVVARWWTARTGFVQRPFGSIASAALLHLPSDKPFLAERSALDFDPDRFLVDYRRYAAGKLWRRRSVNAVLNLLRRQHRHVARM